MLTAIVEGWSFNHHEMLSDLRSHRHLPILLLYFARTPSLCFWRCCSFIFSSRVFFIFSSFFPLESSSVFGKWSPLFCCCFIACCFTINHQHLPNCQLLLLFFWNKANNYQPLLVLGSSFRIYPIVFFFFLNS